MSHKMLTYSLHELHIISQISLGLLYIKVNLMGASQNICFEHFQSKRCKIYLLEPLDYWVFTPKQILPLVQCSWVWTIGVWDYWGDTVEGRGRRRRKTQVLRAPLVAIGAQKESL